MNPFLPAGLVVVYPPDSAERVDGFKDSRPTPPSRTVKAFRRDFVLRIFSAFMSWGKTEESTGGDLPVGVTVEGNGAQDCSQVVSLVMCTFNESMRGSNEPHMNRNAQQTSSEESSRHSRQSLRQGRQSAPCKPRQSGSGSRCGFGRSSCPPTGALQAGNACRHMCLRKMT